MKDKVFGVLQKMGRSFLLPIAVLPVAGMFLGIGSSLLSTGYIEEGGLFYKILSTITNCGECYLWTFTLAAMRSCCVGIG